MELHDALSQIAEIRRRIAETELFRGYRALPVAFSGLLAIAAAALQPALVPDPTADVPGYLRLWVTVAGLCIAINGLGLGWRYGFIEDPVGRARMRLAVGQFAPCVAVGAILPVALAGRPEQAVLLPGLWQVVFGLGVLASCRLMPWAVSLIGGYYLACGAMCLTLSHGELALSPWQMGLPFGLGQTVAAAALYWNLERRP